jgi:uncharacterized sporulation protein YeaH/YhbH (DUF444 family)
MSAQRITESHRRFKSIVKGRVRKQLRKYISSGELLGRQGDKKISIPMPSIAIPRFTHGDKDMGGVGQGSGEPGDGLGGDPQEGGGTGPGAGDGEAEHALEVEFTIAELAEMLGEELELPLIEPKGSKADSTKNRYTSIRHQGPQSLRHFRRTFKNALKRQVAAGIYSPYTPLIPLPEDRRYRAAKELPQPHHNAVIVYMMDVSGCHTEGHFVEMADGTYKDVKDIQVGDVVCSVDLKTQQKRTNPVTEKFSFCTNRILRIRTEDHNELLVTPEHRYFVYNEDQGSIEEKKACDLEPGDFLILVNQFGRGTTVATASTEELSESQSYLLGALLGDGHVYSYVDPNDSQRNSRYACLTDYDEERILYYADCAQGGFGVKGLIRKRGGRTRLHLNSVRLVKWIQEYWPSLCHRSLNRYIEPSLFCQPERVRAAFIRGFYDAEGTVSHHAVEFVSSSLYLVKQFKLLLSYWGIRGRTQRFVQNARRIKGSDIKEGVFYRLSINSKDALIFREEIGFSCRVKQASLTSLCNRQELGTNAMRSRYISHVDLRKEFSDLPSLEKIKSRLYEKGRRCFSQANLERMAAATQKPQQKTMVESILQNGFLLCKVKEVTQDDSSERVVYDFEVENDHNYIIDGILSHNSMGEEQREIVRIETYWINTWLQSQYEGLETRWIIHDHQAKEVDYDTFFRTKEAGGTLISSAYELCFDILEEDYPVSEWNIYPFHFTDGDNLHSSDNEHCIQLLNNKILPLSNVFCYGQVHSPYGSGKFYGELQNAFFRDDRLILSKIDDRSGIMQSIKEFLGAGK